MSKNDVSKIQDDIKLRNNELNRDNVVAIHQQVREFVQGFLDERNVPYIVTRIEGTSRTQYAPTLATRNDLIPEYILSDVYERFRVEADSPRGHVGMRFDVFVYDGKLHMGGEVGI